MARGRKAVAPLRDGSEGRAGNRGEVFDAPIPVMALAAGADIAARDTGGFTACGMILIDPWG
jgi:hypothetical protein